MRVIGLKGWEVVCTVMLLGLLGGCASPGNPDPLQTTNRWMYDFNTGLDRVVLKPASDCYVKVVPRPVRTGVGNFMGNLLYFNVILNDFLQGSWKQGWSDTGRMASNSTVGVLGIFDVATDWGMPAHQNDFGLTLGQWGAGSGAYLVLPLLGPSSGRDVTAVPVAIVTNPLFWLDWPWEISAGQFALDTVDRRSRAETWIRFRDETALDPYVFTRDAYLQYRRARIAGQTGQPTTQPGLYDEPAEAATAPATQPATRPAQ